MREVTKKYSKFSWNADLEEKFQNVKRVVSSVDTLAPYNPKLPLHLFTEASKDEGICYILVNQGRARRGT